MNWDFLPETQYCPPFTGGVGMELQQSGLTIAPTLRFTRWAADNAPAAMTTHRNQVELVFGVRF
jgi:hypothetical protein